MNNNNENLELDFERICILYANINFGYLGMVIGVSFLYFVVYKYSSPGNANIWGLIMFVTYLPRITFSILFARKLKKQEIKPHNVKPWERYMTLSSIVPYICFVAVIYLPYGENELISVLFCTLVFLSLLTGGVLTLTTSLGPIMLYINLSLLSIIAKCLWFQETMLTLLACFMFTGYLLLTKLIIRQNKTLIENIALKIENNKFSLIDPLTQLWNRRRLNLHIEKLVPASIRSSKPFSLIFLDIDHFKEYNDTKGHSSGDELLVKVAEIFLACSRDQDLVVRYGGEEFLIVLPQTKINEAEIIAERIRITVKEKTDVTISAGLAEYSKQINFDQLLQKADEALYQAKEDGRDGFVVAGAH